jgi:cytochrome c oxidase cbb3-type subunit III
MDREDKADKADKEMKNEKSVPLKDHSYDGIRELDNPLPAWWLATFFITIIFGFIYWIHYDIGGAGPTSEQELRADLEEMVRAKARTSSVAGDGAGAAGAGAAKINPADPALIGSGQKVFESRCTACHGPGGAGQIGPNLTDRFWLHGNGRFEDLIGIVKAGVPEKGMPPWETLLRSDDINAVAAYIVSLRDSRPTGGKAPEGREIKE